MRKKRAAGVMSDTARKPLAAADAASPSSAASIPSVAAGSSATPVANPITDWSSPTKTSAPTTRRARRAPWRSRPAASPDAPIRGAVARQIPANVRR